MKRKLGLIVLILSTMHLSGCALPQTGPTSPEYSQEFLLCVRDEWDKEVHGPCTDEALKDWMVLVGI